MRLHLHLALPLLFALLGCARADEPADARLTVFAEPGPRAPGAVDADWPTLLGANGDGVCRETHLRKTWTAAGPPRLWRYRKGAGYAAPAIAGDRLVLFHRVGAFEEAVCLHRETGAFQWRFRQPTDYRDRFGFSDGPRATPVIDGDRVYVYGAQRKLACLELATGKAVWQRDLQAELKLPTEYFGNVTTPLVHGKLLVINVGAPRACVVGLDKATGKRVWATDDPWGASYATPVAAELHGKPRILVFAGGESSPPHGGLLCIDPATGKSDFRVPWRSTAVASVNAANPVVIGNRVFISASYDTGGALIGVDPQLRHRVLWTTPKLGTHWTTTLHADGHLYGFDGRHMKGTALTCLALETGEVRWRERLRWKETRGERQVSVGVYRANMLRADGAYLCLGETGRLAWLDLSPAGCKLLARCRLFDARETWTPPAISRGLLYVCQNEPGSDGSRPALHCYDLRAPGR